MPTILAGTSKQGGEPVAKPWNDKEFHDSSFTLDEMRGLINDICTDVPGMNANPDAWPTGMAGEFQSLSLVLRDQKHGSIFVCKGIHQPDQLHYTISIGSTSSYHVYVARSDKHTEKTRPLGKQHGQHAGKQATVSMYDYRNVGLSWQLHADAVRKLWPAQFAMNSYPNRKRGDSFSIGNSAGVKARGPTQMETSALKVQK